ncbi:hypothetical protein UY3_18017 [Chelonia mydas]|uniref:Uncharacterized protein n=1 Tax=Chelonia mydas TaxID=8469 RepID=M7AIS5_CHEMY|nr:hypothetical protein UY3_18017 [Chelonia mydas]
MRAAGSGGQHIPQPMPLSAACIGLERRTAASGSCDRPYLRMLQSWVTREEQLLARCPALKSSPPPHLQQCRSKGGNTIPCLQRWATGEWQLLMEGPAL